MEMEKCQELWIFGWLKDWILEDLTEVIFAEL